MTIDSGRPPSGEPVSSGSVAADLADLRATLAHQRFPTDQDRLIATCLSRRAPSRLLWRLASLDRNRRYDSLEQVCAEVTSFARVHGVPPTVGQPSRSRS